MKISASAKHLLSISALAVIAGPLYQLECGTYTVTGKIHSDEKGRFVLTLNPGSASPFELLLLGGSIRDRSIREGSEATVRVYVPQPIRTADRPFVFVQKFIRAAGRPAAGQKDAVILESPEPCGDKTRFVAAEKR